MTHAPRMTPGSPEPLGLTLDAQGANVAVFSAHATRIDLCLFDDSGAETARIPLPERTGPIWHGHLAGLVAGQHYGLRAEGPYAPDEGHLFNSAKLLLDPYAHLLTGTPRWHPDQHHGSPADSAAAMPKCVAVPPLAVIDPQERPNVPWEQSVIYEAHVKGLTQLWPGMEPGLRGRIEALGTPEVIGHLQALGITAIELLPVHAFMTEPRLTKLGLENYWGYNTVSFLAPEPRYLTGTGLAGLRETVRRLHAAGIEVILDVVYNHSAEGDGSGPTLSLRGLDNLGYYRRDADAPDGYANDTGCGNTLDFSNPFTLRLALDSLRWWAGCIGVDGFRFDLAPALTRATEANGDSAFLDAVLQDPMLRQLKLIAEPWDIGPGGYALGQFPSPFAEWNDRFRDSARGFWIREPGAGAALADGLLGSASIFDGGGRRSWSSVNFAACHDGFTLADLAAYEDRHNQENGEENRDGHGHNLSANFGVEGETDDPVILSARARRRRNLLATVMLAQGVPMLRAGDEVVQSQNGNNNAYCQDNEINWIDWETGDAAFLEFTRALIALRAEYAVLRQRRFLHGEAREGDGAPNVAWFAFDGGEIAWERVEQEGFCLLLRDGGENRGKAYAASVLIAVNRGDVAQDITLPDGPETVWRRVLDTDAPGQGALAEGLSVAPETVAIFAAEPHQQEDHR